MTTVSSGNAAGDQSLTTDRAGPEGTVLFVDDEPHVLTALRRSLVGAPFALLQAHGGPGALTLMEKNAVDIVVTDVRMPGMDGIELLRRVRAAHPSVERVILNGHVERETVLRSVADRIAR
jgi:YesN/AraC family two-component response regulator